MRRTLALARALLVVLVGTLLVAPGLVGAPAQAGEDYRVGISLSDTNVAVGESVRFSGKVRPLATGKVTLQRREGGQWTTVRRVKLVASSYATSLRFNETGVEFYRAVMPATKGTGKGVSKTRSVRVVSTASNPQIATTSLPSATLGQPYQAQLETVDDRPGTWSVAQGSLPPGLSLNGSTGIISGTPTATTSGEFAILFRDSDGRVVAKMFTISFAQGESLIVTTSLPGGAKGAAYSATLKAKDDRAGTWSITQGTLPAGLNLNATTGVISGTPTANGKSEFTVRFQDAASKVDTKALSITITDSGQAPVIATSSLPNGVVGDPYAVQMHTADGRAGTWSITQGTLPPGLALTASTGVISGTPTAPAIRDITVKFQDGAGLSATREFSIIVQASKPEIVTTSLPSGVKGEAYSTQLLTKDKRPGVWNLAQGTLPAGLALDPSTGVITGTPTTLGTSTFQVRFRDTLGATDTESLTLVVAASRPVISTASLPKGNVGKAYAAQLKTADNRAGAWSITTGTLPAGLALNATTGAITGTPTTKATSSFTVQFKDTAGVTGTKAFQLQIAGACFLFICP